MFYGITINKIISDPGVMSRKSKKNGTLLNLVTNNDPLSLCF
jgi:hypothetical protein